MSWFDNVEQFSSTTSHETNTSTEAHNSHNEGGLMSIDPGVSIWTLITFFLLLILLRVFAWKPIIKSLDDREKFLASSHEEAIKARNEAKKIADDQSSILTEAKREATKIKEAAIGSASENAKKLEQMAIKEKNSIIESAYKEADQIKSQVISENKNTIVKLAIAAAEKIIVSDLDNDKSSKIVDKYLEGYQA